MQKINNQKNTMRFVQLWFATRASFYRRSLKHTLQHRQRFDGAQVSLVHVVVFNRLD